MVRRVAFDIVQHLAALRRYARSLTRDVSAADDLVQQAMLNALEKRERFDPSRPLKPWLLAIVHNEFVSRIRRRAAEQRSLAEIEDAVPAVDEGGPELNLFLREVADRFAALPDPQREVLHLVAIEGLGYREAADVLGLPIGTVMSRLSRARAALREPLEGKPGLRLVVGGRD
ncbi:sigma-70 family RNA polymerase sigma factor [Sphingomonas crocodyli]|uniref:RNA polymerase sigma factor n=1 Tax=Sphingomonas crocodyli TaxID=1979270 RepID=A0A437MB56_9SPHN|nr:sigma-70 family RNA polymerase sigma factor [Sphingomonas crocodyli]RVT94884.1 sigma-70 family RNA polymerase sigma factor [Sphingomonas crocodyli]